MEHLRMELDGVASNPSHLILILKASSLIDAAETTSLGEETTARLGLGLDFDVGHVAIGGDQSLLEAPARDEGGGCSSE